MRLNGREEIHSIAAPFRALPPKAAPPVLLPYLLDSLLGEAVPFMGMQPQGTARVRPNPKWGNIMTDRKDILLIEDNPDDEVLILRALKKSELPNRIIIVRDGAEALEWLFGSGQYADCSSTPLPQAIFLDLKLPKVDGLEVLRQIRANPRTHLLPVIIFTSSDEERDLINSYNQGANSYIRKPVKFDQFVSTIQQLGLYWLTVNEAPPALWE